MKTNLTIEYKRMIPFGTFLLILFTSSVYPSFSQIGGVEEWKKLYGAGGTELLTSGIPTTDGGFLMGGRSDTGIGGDKSEANRGDDDYWIIKIDKDGNKQWDKTLGGDNIDELANILPLPDGYLLIGTSWSGNNGDKTEVNRGKQDYWVVRISSSGNKIWDKTFGGSGDDRISGAVLTSEGGFILAGTSNSPISGDKSQQQRVSGTSDYWVVKINGSGTKVWDKTFGGDGIYPFGNESLASILKAPEGGYMLAGTSSSSAGYEKTQDTNEPIEPYFEREDYWVIKINEDGDKEWDKTIGSNRPDYLKAMIPAPGGGYIFGGVRRTAFYYDSDQFRYYNSLVFTKVTAQVNLEWEKDTYEQYGNDGGHYDLQSISYNASGFYALYFYENFVSYLEKYDFNGTTQYTKNVVDQSIFLKFNNEGEGFLGSSIYKENLYAYYYGLTKLKPEATTPKVEIQFSHPSYPTKQSVHISTQPVNINGAIAKVEFYADNNKIGEDNNAPYAHTWEYPSTGDHKIYSKVITASGATLLSENIPWKTFAYGGYQMENSYLNLNDVGTNQIGIENASTLNGNGAVKISDIGDKIGIYLHNNTPGTFIFKARIRTGWSDATGSNPAGYIPEGYSFWIHQTPVTFTLNTSTVSGKDPSFGGSYWGVVESPPVYISNSATLVSIQANKQWLGVDYVELVKVSQVIEAEKNYQVVNDVGSNPVRVENYNTLSNGSSVKLPDSGDKIKIHFETASGNHLIKVRLKTGWYNSSASDSAAYLPNGYSFLVNGIPATFQADPTSISEKDPSYGGSYWGFMTCTANLINSGWNYLEIQANTNGVGIDYIEVINTSDLHISPSINIHLPSFVNQGSTVDITVEPIISRVSIAKVEFYANNLKIGEDLTPPYSFSWQNSTPGVHYVYGKAIEVSGKTLLSFTKALTISQSPAEFYRAVNFNGPETTILTHKFESSNNAPDFTYQAKAFANQSVALAPSTDPLLTTIIRSSLYSTRTIPATFTLANVPLGTYEVYVYAWEDNYSDTYSLWVEGQPVLENYQSGHKGNWKKHGPFKTTITDGNIELKAAGGDANISAIEIWKVKDVEFYRAINLNGPATKIDNINYESSNNAPNFTYQAKAFANQSVALNPKTDQARATMIRSSLYATRTIPASFTFNNILAGTYDLFVYAWEDNYSQTFSITVNDNTILTNHKSGTAGSWRKLGPFKTIVTNGIIKLGVLGGDANISGIELWGLTGAQFSQSGNGSISRLIANKNTIMAFPNPISQQLTVQLPANYTGKVNLSLIDGLGISYLMESKELSENGEVILDLPLNKMSTGLYFLKIKSDNKEEIIRLSKE